MQESKKAPSRAKKAATQREGAYRKKSSKKNGFGSRKIMIIAICIALAAILIGIIAGVIFFSTRDDNGLILPNIKIAGVDVGNLSKDDAISAVRLATKDTYSKNTMVVQVLKKEAQLTPGNTGVSLDVVAAVNAAYAYGRTGSSAQQQKDQLLAMTSGYTVDILPYLSLDSAAIKAALSNLGSYYSSTLSQTSYKITGSDSQKNLVITMGTPEYSLDLNALYDQVMAAYNSNTFFVEGECSVIEPNKLDLNEIYTANCTTPVDAKIDPETYEVIPEINGYGFDVDQVQTQLDKAQYGEVLTIPFSKITPKVTAANLSSMLYRDVLGTYTATDVSEPNRDTNLRLACEAINGKILYPGDIFSFNHTLGQRTEANGYKLGPSYSGNDTVYTIGGGICQVSSALYYSALLSDLEIVQRECHQFATTYMPLGMDAMVSWGQYDFMFRNNTNYPIRIEAAAAGGITTVKILGTDEKDYKVEMEYKILDTINYTTSYQKMDANNSKGYKDGDFIVQPYTGYNIQTYRCKYKKATNELLSKEKEDTSDYKMRNGIICQITGNSSSQNPGESGSVSDGPGALPPE